MCAPPGGMWSQLVVPWWWEWEVGGGWSGLEALLGALQCSAKMILLRDVLLFAVCLCWAGLALITY